MPLDTDQGERQANMAVLAWAKPAALAARWAELGTAPAHERVRGPETGLVMVRGRAGGGGAPFNLGEATVTRATVRLATGEVGHAYALGRDSEKVVTAALVDALWQQPANRDAIRHTVIEPLAAVEADADRKRRGESAATKVNFFTLVRGED